MKTKKQFSMTALAIVAIVALALAFIGCDNGDDKNDPPPPHESTITAFGKTATVTGDASIPKKDFDEAVERLQTALSVLNADSGLPQNVIGALTRMMSRNITILIGDAAPADVNGALTMGVGYNSAPIENALYSIANSGGFADPPTPCLCPEGTTHEPNEKCCEGTGCNCQIAEPAVREFLVIFNFENDDSGEQLRNVDIKDERTKCGSADLENVKVNNKSIITIIEEAVMGAFNNVELSNSRKNRFRTAFGVDGGVTIYVDNPETPYKMRATDKKTIYIHIDYLKSTPADIQEKVFDVVSAMDNIHTEFPFNAE